MSTEADHSSSPASQTESVSAARPVAVGEKLVQSSPDKIEKARQAKEDGNAAFKAGEYRTAIKKYHHALMYTKGVVSQGDLPAIPGMEQMTKFIATDEEKATASELTVTICNNLAACFLKTEKWEKVVEYSNKVLEAHPDNAKALFRRGVASIHLNKTEQAEWDLTRAQEINPGDAGIKKQLGLLEQRKRQHEKTEQKLYSAMFQN